MAPYLENIIKQFDYYKSLGDKTFDQISDEKLFWSYSNESNSIAVIVNHLSGNMLSHWTDFLTTDGEKTWRNRDTEFDSNIKNRLELLEKWNSLSIPKGNSEDYNQEKNSKPKRKQHFTSDL
ncbi:MAG: DUF1572 family protein [Flavobacteriaceae bacterium]